MYSQQEPRSKKGVKGFFIKHGLTGSPLHMVWAAMNQRCSNPNHKNYASYGGRGVSVCDRWRKSFESFLADMGPRPDGMTLERIDNNGNYDPDNCRWATRKEQTANRRPGRVLVASGRSMPIAEWALIEGIPETVIRNRLALGWSHSRAVLTKPRYLKVRNA